MTREMRGDGHEPATKADLLGMTSRLDGHDQRFDGIIARLDGHDRQFEVIISRLDEHDRRLESIDGNLRRLNVGFAKMEGDMTELKGKVDVLLHDFSRFSTILERVSTNFESCLRKMDPQGSMLMEHEGRIKKLESRPN